MRALSCLLILATAVTIATACGRSRPRRCPPRDRTPPVINCPPDIHETADPFQVNTKVTWTEPDAYDNGRKISATRNGRAPGKLFSEGRTIIRYSARDGAGNYASCSFSIYVTVVRCPWFEDQTDGWKMCHVSTDMRRGSVCRFGCYDGHELVGPTRTTCQDDGRWDNSFQPFCQKFECPALTPIGEQVDRVDIVCTDGNYYRSICTYMCRPGYGVLPGRSKLKVCGATKRWRGRTPECVDVSPPVFDNCPHVVVGYAERSKTSGRVAWSTPSATDNSGRVSVIQTSGPTPGTELDVGEYDVQYLAYDNVNNTAVCEFKVVVKQIRCHTIYPHPYTTVTCPNGRIYGSECDFSCDNSSSLNGYPTTECQPQGTGNIRYGQWSFGNHQPYCELQDLCPPLTPPDNGALACDRWLSGKFCQMFCQSGYYVTDLDNINLHKELHVCGDNGQWYRSEYIPDCQEVEPRLVSYYLIEVDYLYYDGVCSEDSEIIKANFIEAFQTLAGMCQAPDCVPANVEVICGETTDRDKRSTGFTVIRNISLPGSTGLTDVVSQQIAMKNAANTAFTNGQFNLTVNGNEVPASSLTVSKPEVSCEDGSVPDSASLQCVKCGPGHYHDTSVDRCRPCSKGYYQELSQQTSCLPCPAGKTTRTLKTKSAELCEDACSPGYYSSDGAQPCSQCDTGTFSTSHGSTSCTSCPGSKVTSMQGATSAQQCKEFDITYPIQDGDEDSAPASVLVNNSQAASILNMDFWVSCSVCQSLVLISNSSGLPILSMFPTLDTFLTLYGTSYDVALTTSQGNWTHFQVIWSNSSITAKVNGEDVLSEVISSSDIPQILNVTVGGAGFVGSISQFNMRSGDNYTPNLDSCFNSDTVDLLAWNQFYDTDGTFVKTESKCDAFDNCLSSPCMNNGSCTDRIDSYICACAAGFTGSSCEINIDDCTENACENGATCIDDDNAYICSCPYGFTGELCERKTVDGNWAKWEEWSQCSVTCGTGIRSRSRVCSDPNPINGGKMCEGDDEETEPCEEEVVCVNECNEDPEVENGLPNCEWVDEANDTRRCSPTCNDGFTFDSDRFVDQAMPILCGNATGYTWNIKTEDNPEGKLPSCTAQVEAESNTLVYYGTYDGLQTDDVTDQIQNVLQNVIRSTECVTSGRCQTPRVNTNVGGTQNRKKRATSGVTFTLEMDCFPQSSIEECYDMLAAVVSALNQAVADLALTVNVNGVNYDVDVNSTQLDGWSTCSSGFVPVFHYCVPCGTGSYQAGDFCEQCPYGRYQDVEGQSSCKPCPDGWTTPGVQSSNISECSIPVEDDDESQLLLIIVCACAGSIVVLGILTCIILFKMCKKDKVEPTTPQVTMVLEQIPRKHEENCKTSFDKRNLKQSGVTCLYDNPAFLRGVTDISIDFKKTIPDDSPL